MCAHIQVHVRLLLSWAHSARVGHHEAPGPRGQSGEIICLCSTFISAFITAGALVWTDSTTIQGLSPPTSDHWKKKKKWCSSLNGNGPQFQWSGPHFGSPWDSHSVSLQLCSLGGWHGCGLKKKNCSKNPHNWMHICNMLWAAVNPSSCVVVFVYQRFHHSLPTSPCAASLCCDCLMVCSRQTSGLCIRGFSDAL